MAAIGAAALDGLVITDDALFESIGQRLALFAATRRLPTIAGIGRVFAQQGGLMSYAANFFEVGRRAAGQVDRILRGARPADLPIDQATEFRFTINLKTAQELGLRIPASLLARADEVIE
jgi:putative tryptophan/tyrosine transport system substrate-binding protein